jgi:hypothetical protein
LVPPRRPYEEAFFRWFCWMRHGKTLAQLIIEAGTSWTGMKKLKLLEFDYEAWRFGKKNLYSFRYKFDTHHLDLISLGLGHGLERLASEELAECFDEYCPLHPSHSSDYLKKFRAKIIKAIKAR